MAESAREQGRLTYHAVAAEHRFTLGQMGIRLHAKNPHGKLTGDHLAWKRGFEAEAVKYEHGLMIGTYMGDWRRHDLQNTPGALTPHPERAPSWFRRLFA